MRFPYIFLYFLIILIKLSVAWNITQNRYRVILFISSFSIYFWLLSSNKYNRISLKFRPTRFTYGDYGSLLPKIIESVQNSSNSHRHRQQHQQQLCIIASGQQKALYNETCSAELHYLNMLIPLCYQQQIIDDGIGDGCGSANGLHSPATFHLSHMIQFGKLQFSTCNLIRRKIEKP